jgi:mannose-6-phosphate isomerase-like protein (cupin superfamily)
MRTQEYVDKGIIQDYCLGMLGAADKAEFEMALINNAELRAELEKFQEGMEHYVASKQENTLALDLKGKIWATLENIDLEAEIDIANPPRINKYSDTNKWLSAVNQLLPAKIGAEKFIYPLQDSDKITQLLVKSTTDFEDEIHNDFQESILILEGRCECYIGGQMIALQAGDYLDIPMNEIHNVIVKSKYVSGIIQRIAVA